MLFTGFFILFLTVVFANGVSTLSLKYFPDEKQEKTESSEDSTINKLLVEQALLRQEENETEPCGQLYKECIGKIDQDESYVEVCTQTLQCTADYFECRMQNSTVTTEETIHGGNSTAHVIETTSLNVEGRLISLVK